MGRSVPMQNSYQPFYQRLIFVVCCILVMFRMLIFFRIIEAANVYISC